MTDHPVRVVIVSGGSRGLGQAIVEGFLREPGHVVATFSRTKTAFIAETEHSAMLADGFIYEAMDIRDKEAVQRFIGRVFALHGRIDVLVNNASIAHEGVLATLQDDDIDAQVDIDLKGTIYLTKYCVRRMLLSDSGRIINISSVVGRTGYRGLTVYSAAKAAIDGFTRSLARELGTRQITVNSIAPGFIDTEMAQSLREDQRGQIERRTPLGRLATTADIVPLVLFLASSAAGFITGQAIVVDGGLSA